MIQLRDVSGKDFYLNSELIYRIDSHYDTIITLVDQKKIVVMDKPTEIVKKVVAYKKSIHIDLEVET